MAGKSTLLRTLCAVALLANVGLMVPAVSAKLPFLDAFVLRNFSGDSPVENKSAFAVEMEEISVILRDITPRSLVLLDELGKGTEAAAATGLSAAVLKRFCEVGCLGVFATHFHDLVSPSLPRPPGLKYAKMELVAEHESGGIPTYRTTLHVQEGVCTTSLALQVAQDCGVPPAVLKRATELLEGLLKGQELVPHTHMGTMVTGHLEQEHVARVQDIVNPLEGRAPAPSAGAVVQGEANCENGPRTQPVPDKSQSTSPMDNIARSLADARRLLESCTLKILKEYGKDLGPTNRPASYLIPPGCLPPPTHGVQAVVYLIRWPAGYWYCGESESLRQRLGSHKSRWKEAAGDLQKAHILYTLVTDKTVARRAQTLLIQQLEALGFPLLSRYDAKLKSFSPPPQTTT